MQLYFLFINKINSIAGDRFGFFLRIPNLLIYIYRVNQQKSMTNK